ncbi:hypothetical protein Goklo_013325, partial [Gossypium klotzschianum]|nr:hypothetical protein [Gossypium klotzschianum]
MANFENETFKVYSQIQFKGEDTGLGWNLIKRTVDASDDLWESGLKLPSVIKVRAPSLGILPSEFFEDIDSNMLEENEEETVINDVHIDGNNQKRKTPEAETSHFKTRRKKSLKQIGGA